jgi:hypothetical protein
MTDEWASLRGTSEAIDQIELQAFTPGLDRSRAGLAKCVEHSTNRGSREGSSFEAVRGHIIAELRPVVQVRRKLE